MIFASLMRIVLVFVAYLTYRATGCRDAEEAFHLTNTFRARAGSDPLTWSDDLARTAEEWARLLVTYTCKPSHSPEGFRNFAGENLTLGPGWKTSDFCVIAATGWFDEWKHYKFTTRPWSSNGGQFSRIGHFSQTVWRETRQMGCGSAVGDDCAAVVCHYWPRGNMATNEAFAANVRPVRATGVSAKMPFPSSVNSVSYGAPKASKASKAPRRRRSPPPKKHHKKQAQNKKAQIKKPKGL